MKVLILPSWYPPLGGYFFQELSEATASEECNIDLIVNTEISSRKFRIKNLFVKNIFNKENNLNVYRSYMQRIPKINRLNNIRFIKETFKLYEKYISITEKPDIIHAHSVFYAGATASLINKKYKIPYIITEHRSRFTSGSLYKKTFPDYLMPYIKNGFKNAKKIVTVSPALNNKIIDIEQSSEKKIISIPNTIDTNFFKYKEKQKKKKNFSFFCLANLEYYKGIDILLNAFRTVIDKTDKNVYLRIGGTGELYSSLHKKCSQLSLCKNVIFLGKIEREQVRAEMQNADCFVLPSRFEAFGVVFIEALACGTPVIGTDAGGPKYIINKKNGIIVHKKNQKMLAKAMIEMIKNRNNYNNKDICKEALKKYDKDIIAKKYVNLYKEMI